MTESSFGGDNEMTEGATVEGEDAVDSATADREAAFDDATSSAEGNVSADDAVVASPPKDSTITDDLDDADRGTSHEADVEAGYDDDSAKS